MQFIHIDLGNLNGGDVAEVTLSGGANVHLMDSTNLSAYRSGRPYRAVGGVARVSPLRLEIPHAGHWHVAVDMQGLRGSVRASARVIRRAS